MSCRQWHIYQLRVRYQETDQMRVVYHANYLNWFEIGRTEMIRELGMPYRLLEERGLLLPLVEVEIKFRKPAKYDDWISIYTRVIEHNHLRLRFESRICRNTERSDEPSGELLVSGTTKHVWLNREWKPARIDKEAPDLFRLLEE